MSSNHNNSQKVKYIKGVHRHGSETFLIVLKNQKSLETTNIIKSSTTENGINLIISECEGISWYNKLSRNKIVYDLEKKTKTYHRIIIEFNRGFYHINSNTNYLKIKKYLDLTINHYIEIWKEYKNKKYAPFHGDLSLVGNVMFNDKNDVLFVDWEQFDNNLKMPTGLDPMMTIIENVWYETLRSKKIDPNIFIHIKDLIQRLKKAGLISPLLLEKPAQNSLNFINLNTEIWKGQHYKLPALKIPKKYLIEIDNAVAN